MKDPILVEELEHVDIHIYYDPEPSNPREEFDHIAKMVCFHKRYSLGDKHNFKSPDEFQEFLELNPKLETCPLYLYDHSGITISTKPFSDPWDSGQVGWIYVDKKDLEKAEEKKLSNKVFIHKAKGIMESEVSEYDDYVTGNIFGFEILDKENHRVMESCWGFYGQDVALAEAKETVKSLLPPLTKNEKAATLIGWKPYQFCELGGDYCSHSFRVEQWSEWTHSNHYVDAPDMSLPKNFIKLAQVLHLIPSIEKVMKIAVDTVDHGGFIPNARNID